MCVRVRVRVRGWLYVRERGMCMKVGVHVRMCGVDRFLGLITINYAIMKGKTDQATFYILLSSHFIFFLSNPTF